MFGLTDNKLVAPTATAVFGDFAKDQTLSDYLEKLKASSESTKVVVGGMMLGLVSVVVKGLEGQDNAKSCFTPGALETIIAKAADYERTKKALDNDDKKDEGVTKKLSDDFTSFPDKAMLELCMSNAGPALGWMVNLINAAKKSKLSAENVEGFFASLGASSMQYAVVANLINKMACCFPDLIAEESFRNVLADSKWSEYRMTRYSTGKIILTVLPDLKKMGLVSGSDEKAVQDSADAPWDRKLADEISDTLKALAHLFLQSSGRGIDDWYQGNRALALFPASKIAGAKALFAAYLKISNDMTRIKSATTIPRIANIAKKLVGDEPDPDYKFEAEEERARLEEKKQKLEAKKEHLEIEAEVARIEADIKARKENIGLRQTDGEDGGDR